MISLRDIIKKILNEDSKIGSISGTQEKELNTGLRTIHNKFKDDWNSINTKTNQSEINYGGCGIFAKLLYYNIKKYLNITPQLVFLADDTPPKDINLYKDLYELNDVDVRCMHVVLRINDYYIDSTGIHKFSWYERVYPRYHLHPLDMTITTLNRFVNYSANWNSTFNRYKTGDINKDMVTVIKQVAELTK